MKILSVNNFNPTTVQPIRSKYQSNNITFQGKQIPKDAWEKIGSAFEGLVSKGLAALGINRMMSNNPNYLKEMQNAFSKFYIKVEKSKDGKSFVLDKLGFIYLEPEKEPKKNLNEAYQETLKKYFDKVTEIEGNAYFYNSGITRLRNLKKIGGDADFSYAKITRLGKLKEIGGDANFSHSKVRDLGNLKEIGWYTLIGDSKVTKEMFKDIKVGGKIID